MKDENKDQYDIKKFQEVVGESQMMIPDSISRRDKALEDLKEFVALLKKDEGSNVELMNCEWMVEANKIVGVTDSDSKADGSGEDIAETAVEGLADGEAFQTYRSTQFVEKLVLYYWRELVCNCYLEKFVTNGHHYS